MTEQGAKSLALAACMVVTVVLCIHVTLLRARVQSLEESNNPTQEPSE